MVQKVFLLTRSLVILYIMLYLGNLIAHYVPVGVPGSIWGLLLLFLGLTTRLIHLDWIYLGASFLIRFMAVLFVPVSVGIIKYSDLLREQVNILLLPNIVSTLYYISCDWFFLPIIYINSNLLHINGKK